MLSRGGKKIKINKSIISIARCCYFNREKISQSER